MIVRFNIRRKLDIIRYDFSVWLRTGSYPPDIKRFRSNTGKYLLNNAEVCQQSKYQNREGRGHWSVYYTSPQSL